MLHNVGALGHHSWSLDHKIDVIFDCIGKWWTNLLSLEKKSLNQKMLFSFSSKNTFQRKDRKGRNFSISVRSLFLMQHLSLAEKLFLSHFVQNLLVWNLLLKFKNLLPGSLQESAVKHGWAHHLHFWPSSSLSASLMI